MKSELKDLTGLTFGNLVVLKRADDYIYKSTGKKSPQWLCLCKCGKKKIIMGRNLKSGSTKSCGCLAREISHRVHKKANNYENVGNNITKVFFNNCDNDYFLCDSEDWNKISNITWMKDSSGYVYGVINGQNIRLHRYIMKVDNEKDEIDHIDGNPLNNIKSNLRVCSKDKNSMNQKISSKNKSGHVGIYFDKNRGKWCATINANKKNIYLGRYDSFSEAVKAREQAEEKYHGEYATKNSRNGKYEKIELYETLKMKVE